LDLEKIYKIKKNIQKKPELHIY